MLPPFNLPEGIFLLITDELSSPASFLLHGVLSSRLKESKGALNVILSVSEDITKWKTVASKSNVNVSQHQTLGSLDFVNVLDHVQSPGTNCDARSPMTNFGNLLDIVSASLERSQSKDLPLVILDDLTSLEWIGFPLLDISRFARALRAICQRANATLIIGHHIVTPNEPDDLFRHLQQMCDYHVDVRPLQSGRSGSVSGEIALHPGASASAGTRRIIRSSAVQYRLTDSGPVFFSKGTGGGVL